MKIAITSKGKTLDAEIEPRFGRAAYILIVDTENFTMKILDNTLKAKALKKSGIQKAKQVNDNGATTLLTGFCGPNAFKTLKAEGIKVANILTGTVREAILAFNGGKLSYTDEYTMKPPLIKRM
jgi:predicted Fe-Mo cluster-binding NifX family protein